MVETPYFITEIMMSGYIDQNGIEFNAIRFIHFKENTQDTVIIMFKG